MYHAMYRFMGAAEETNLYMIPFNNLKVSSKLYLLLCVMSAFIIGIGWYGIHEIGKMHRNTQTLYADRVVPMAQLKKILFSYAVSIMSTAQQVKTNELTFDEARKVIDQSEETIRVNWKAYMQTYFTPEEKLLVEETAVLMRQSAYTIEQLKIVFNHEDADALDRVINDELYPAVNPVIVHLNALIDLQVRVSEELNKDNAEAYRTTSYRFYIVISLLLIFAIPFSIYIFRNIHELIDNLQTSNLKLTESERRYRNIFENVQDVFYQTNLDGITLDVSPSVKHHLGFTPEELIGTHVSNIYYSKEDREKGLAMLREKGFLKDYELRFKSKNEELVYVSLNALLIMDADGKPNHIDGSYRNITEQKSAEKEREKMVADIIQRNKKFEQFAFIISHNLRGPVANILGIESILKLSISQEDRATAQELLFKAVQDLDIIIKDLNYILEVRTEITEHKETVCLSELVSVITSGIQNVIRKQHAVITTDFSAIDKMVTLKSYMHSIFYNLISNALKFGRSDGETHITIKSEIHNGTVTIFFRDNGRGIDLARHGEAIFGLYKRFHLDVEGKGLGLFMVKTQTEVLGGNIDVKSQPDTGTEFRIEFPV